MCHQDFNNQTRTATTNVRTERTTMVGGDRGGEISGKCIWPGNLWRWTTFFIPSFWMWRFLFTTEILYLNEVNYIPQRHHGQAHEEVCSLMLLTRWVTLKAILPAWLEILRGTRLNHYRVCYLHTWCWRPLATAFSRIYREAWIQAENWINWAKPSLNEATGCFSTTVQSILTSYQLTGSNLAGEIFDVNSPRSPELSQLWQIHLLISSC